MAPILFQIGGLEIPSYPVFMVLGVLVGVWIGWKEALRMGYSQRQMAIFLVVIIPLAVLMGVINNWLFSPSFALGLQHGMLIFSSGFVVYGILLTVLVGTAISTRINKGPMGRSLDTAALVLTVILGFTRIGCFMTGCCYGRQTEGFGGMFLPDLYGEWARRYPTQLLLMGLDAVLFAGLWRYRRGGAAEGKVTLAFLFWFGLGRLLIDSLRELKPVAWGLSLHQLADGLIILAVAGVMVQHKVETMKKHV